MSARTPTSPPARTAINIIPGQRIVTSEVSLATTDQQYLASRHGMLMSDFFNPVLVTAGTWSVVRRYRIRGIDRCGLAATENVQFAIYAYCTPAVPTGNCDFSVGLYASGIADYVGFSVTGATRSTPSWRGWTTNHPGAGTALPIPTDGTEFEVILGAIRDSDAAPRGVFVGGLAIFSA